MKEIATGCETRSLRQPIIFRMRTNPDPGNRIRMNLANRPVLVAYPYGITVSSSAWFLEFERVVIVISLPKIAEWRSISFCGWPRMQKASLTLLFRLFKQEIHFA